MKTPFSSEFLEISFFEEHKILQIKWFSISEQMTDEDFKNQILHEKNAVKTYKPKTIFADATNFAFPISPILQEWHNDFLFPTFIEERLKKIGILVSNDIVVQMSVEQLINDDKNITFITQYFNDKNKAFEWLLV